MGWLHAVRGMAVLAVLGAAAISPACLVEVSDLPERPEDGGAEAAPGTRELGDRCNAAERCLPGLECLPQDQKPFGIAGGLCTKSCLLDAECPSHARCFPASVLPSGRSICVEKCTYGDADPRKCHGRRDVTCLMYETAPMTYAAACVPFCNSDEDCSGRRCNRFNGECGDVPKVGAAPHTPCSNDNSCRGRCDEKDPLSATCTEFCTVGAPGSCRADPSWGFELACVPLDGAKDGDLARCTRECTCNANCGGGSPVCVVDRGFKRFCGKGGEGIPACPVR